MKKGIYIVPIMSFIVCTAIYGQETPVEKGLQAITSDAIKAQLGFLASDWMEGREAGEKGEYIASDYIASILQLHGVKPGGDYLQKQDNKDIQSYNRSYFQNFVLLKSITGPNQIFKVKSVEGIEVKTTDFTFNVDFTLRPSGQPVEIDAPVIFAGYGFRNDKIKYNDFGKIDLKGKFILKVTGYPGFVEDVLTPSEINVSVRDAESYIKETGAAGIIEVNPLKVNEGNAAIKEFMNPSPNEGSPRTGKPSARYSLPGKTIPDDLIRIKVSVKTANEILKGSGITIDDYIKKADFNLPYVLPSLTGKSVYLKTDVRISQVVVRNVIGIIEGNRQDQIIVVGAHYDHLGIGNGYIWNGSDDNASGTVGAMTLAKAIMVAGKKPEKTIIIALWTAEEKGLLGSAYYLKNLKYPLKYLRLNLNLDMISRYISDDNTKGVLMNYTKSCEQFKTITETNLKRYGIDLLVDYQPTDDPPGGSDHMSFAEAGVPIMRFKPGHREEYHTPQDETEKTDWDIMEKIIRICFTNIWELSNSAW